VKRITEIDIARGLAIILVVIGHLTLRSHPEGNDWYVILRENIYLFHMPFFMFLSGIILGYKYENLSSVKIYYQLVKEKFKRLIVPFFSFGFIILVGKKLFENILFVDNLPKGSILDEGLKIVILPFGSSAAFLWFVYVLFFYYLLFSLVIYKLKLKENEGKNKKFFALGLLCIILHFIKATDYFAINSILQYSFVFLLGIYVAEFIESFIKFAEKYKVIFLAIFSVSFLLPYLGTNYTVSKMIIGILSIPAIFSITRISFIYNSKILIFIGEKTFPIYLMNTIFIGLAKGLILKFYGWDGMKFLIIAPFLFFSGLLLPIFVSNLYEKTQLALINDKRRRKFTA